MHIVPTEWKLYHQPGELRQFSEKDSSVIDLKVKLIEQLENQLLQRQHSINFLQH